MEILEVDNLRKEFGTVVAVNNISFSVEQGHVVGLIGPNGAGKTTLLRILATVLAPTRGTARLLGYDLTRQYLDIRKQIGFMPDFFNLEIPILLLITLIALYFSCWALKGILRKFNREQEPLFTRIGAFLFLLGYEFVLFGLYYRHLPHAGTNMNYSYWLISLLAILAIPPTSLRSFDKYLEHSGLVRERHSSNARAIVSVLSYSNLSLALGLFAAWAAASIWISRITGMQLTRCLYPLLTTLSFYLLFVLLLELYVVYSPLSAKIGLLLGFIGIVYLFFPLILSAILESKIVYLYSPLGFWWNLFERPHWVPTVTTSTQRSVLLTSALLCLIPALLVAKRYAGILAIRRKM